MRSTRMFFCGLGLVAGALLMAGCATRDDYLRTVEVRNVLDQPIEGAQVYLTGRGLVGETGRDGTYRIAHADHPLSLVVERDGFETAPVSFRADEDPIRILLKEKH